MGMLKNRKRKAARTASKPSHRRSGASPEIRIGGRLKHARLMKELSLRQLADQIDCSESFISKIENNKVRPSLAMLHKLVSTLDLNVSALFAEGDSEADSVTVMRRSKRPVIRVDPLGLSNGIALERLIPNASGALLQANIHHIKPGANTDGAIEHEGKEFGYVLEGILRLVVNDVVYTIRRGDSFSFASHIPHKYSNPGKTFTRVLWVNTPPTF